MAVLIFRNKTPLSAHGKSGELLNDLNEAKRMSQKTVRVPTRFATQTRLILGRIYASYFNAPVEPSLHFPLGQRYVAHLVAQSVARRALEGLIDVIFNAEHSETPELLSLSASKRFQRVYARKPITVEEMLTRANTVMRFALNETQHMTEKDRETLFFALGLISLPHPVYMSRYKGFSSLKKRVAEQSEQSSCADTYIQHGSKAPMFFSSTPFHESIMGGTHGRDFYSTAIRILNVMRQYGVHHICARSVKHDVRDSVFQQISYFNKNYLTYYTGLHNYFRDMIRKSAVETVVVHDIEVEKNL